MFRSNRERVVGLWSSSSVRLLLLLLLAVFAVVVCSGTCVVYMPSIVG